MKTRKVIDGKNTQTKSPISFTLILYLLFDKWGAPMWLYGAVGMILLIWLIVWIADVVNTRSIDIFKDWEDNPEYQRPKSKFQSRLQNLSQN